MNLSPQKAELSGKYALGVGDVTGPATRELLEGAGVQRGMRVADLGSRRMDSSGNFASSHQGRNHSR